MIGDIMNSQYKEGMITIVKLGKIPSNCNECSIPCGSCMHFDGSNYLDCKLCFGLKNRVFWCPVIGKTLKNQQNFKPKCTIEMILRTLLETV